MLISVEYLDPYKYIFKRLTQVIVGTPYKCNKSQFQITLGIWASSRRCAISEDSTCSFMHENSGSNLYLIMFKRSSNISKGRVRSILCKEMLQVIGIEK